MSQSTPEIVLMLVGMAIVTYGLRVGLWLSESRRFPPHLRRMLDYVPVAALSAIVFPLVLLHDGQFFISIRNAPLAGAMVTGLIVWRSKHLLLGIAGGLLAYAAWRLLLPT